jgi:uncharacterized protein (PEP-CTERM system associated)
MMNRFIPISLFLVSALGLIVPHVAWAQAITEQQAATIPFAASEPQVATNQASGKPNWLITPSLGIEGTFTDNVNLSATNKKSDFITQVSPGIRIGGRSGRATANLNYQWQQYNYLEESSRSNQQRSLAADGQLELVEQWLFIEASHNIAQRSTSVFGTQGVGNELNNANRTEVASYRISPYIQGRLAGSADYQLRYTGTHTSSDTGVLSGATAATTAAWNGRLAGTTPLSLLGWSANTDHLVIRHSNGFENKSDRSFGTLIYQADPQVRLTVSVGIESDNYLSGIERQATTTGLGLDWAPTERTLLSLKKDRRSHGDTYSAVFTHRSALTTWKLSDSRNIYVPTPDLALATRSTFYDYFYQQLAPSYPNDPVGLAAATESLLALYSIPANTPFSTSLTSQAYVERRQMASVALTGANNTVTFMADRSNSQRIGEGIPGLLDDLAANQEIRQTGFSASWAHRMTPHAVLTLSALASRSTGSSNVETTLRSVSLRLTTQLGPKTSGSLGLRQTSFDGAGGFQYDEQALMGSMLFKF